MFTYEKSLELKSNNSLIDEFEFYISCITEAAIKGDKAWQEKSQEKADMVRDELLTRMAYTYRHDGRVKVKGYDY